jgi:hypothetical protein
LIVTKFLVPILEIVQTVFVVVRKVLEIQIVESPVNHELIQPVVL